MLKKLMKMTESPLIAYNHFIKFPYAPFLVQMVVNRHCNLACGYCNEYDHKSEPVPKERLYKTIDKLAELNTRSITFTGGEPLLHPDLIKVIVYASRKISKVSMVTNGFLLTEKLIIKLNKTGLNRMQISIDGVEPNTITQKVLKNSSEKLKLLAKFATFKVHINTVLGCIPFSETLEVVKFAKALELETTVQWMHNKIGQVMNPANIGKREIDALTKVCNLPVYHSKEIMQVGLYLEKKWKCRAGSRFLYIDEFSKAYFCSQAKPLWNCAVENLDFNILKNNFFMKKPCSAGCTLGCVRDSSKYDFFRKQ